MPGAAAATMALLSASTQLRLLATSRHPLGLGSEAVVPLDPLAVPTQPARVEDSRRSPPSCCSSSAPDRSIPPSVSSPTTSQPSNVCSSRSTACRSPSRSLLHSSAPRPWAASPPSSNGTYPPCRCPGVTLRRGIIRSLRRSNGAWLSSTTPTARCSTRWLSVEDLTSRRPPPCPDATTFDIVGPACRPLIDRFGLWRSVPAARAGETACRTSIGRPRRRRLARRTVGRPRDAPGTASRSPRLTTTAKPAGCCDSTLATSSRRSPGSLRTSATSKR